MTSDKKISINYIATIAAIGGLLFGFDTGVISGALLFIKTDWNLDSFQQGWIVSSVLVGAVLGAITSGNITDALGRKKIILITAFLFFIGSIATALARTPLELMLYRGLIGYAIGVASYSVPLYIAEISPDEKRGALVSLNQLAITIGIVVSYLVDQFFADFEHGWRYMMGFSVLPAIILGIGMMFLPDTPRWLISKNKDDDAKDALSMIYDEQTANQKLSEIKSNMVHESESSFKELLSPWIRPALIVGIGLMLFQQITGINTVIYYAPTIFQMAGFESEFAAISATVGIGVVNVLLTIVSIQLIDKLGRKPLLYIGLTGMFISLSILAIAFGSEDGSSLKWITVASLVLYVASFAISLGPVCWLIISEIYPTQIRGLAMSVATVANWTFNLVIALTFLPLIDWVGTSQTFWIFAILTIFAFIFCYKYVPETKGKSLEEIEHSWKDQ